MSSVLRKVIYEIRNKSRYAICYNIGYDTRYDKRAAA